MRGWKEWESMQLDMSAIGVVVVIVAMGSQPCGSKAPQMLAGLCATYSNVTS